MNEEATTAFPSGWSSMPYADAVDGISTNKKKINQKKYLESGLYPIFDQGNNHIGGYTDDPEKIIYCDFPVIIFGDHTRAVKMAKEPFAAGADGVKVLQPKKFISPKLLQYFTNYLAISIKDKGYARHYQWVAKEEIGIPPGNEQHRIVAKIEELFSELDKAVESLKKAREQLNVYRQALLKHAFEGKLTEQWRKDNANKLETADQLLERIKQERKTRYQQKLEDWKAVVKQWEVNGKDGKKPAEPKRHKQLELPNSYESKEFNNLPEFWCLVKIGDVASVGTGGTPLKSRSDYYENGEIAWVTSGALNNAFVSEASGYVTDLAIKETNLRIYPEHTLVMAMYGEGKTRGKCSELLIPATTNQAIAAMVQSGIEERIRPYLKWFLMKNYNDIRRKSSGGVQPNLNLGIVENTVFPICSLGEMNQIVIELECKLSVIDEVDISIDKQLKKSESLRQSILKKAFSGQLVPQNPNDEPASVLLERIAREKAEAVATVKKVRKAKKK